MVELLRGTSQDIPAAIVVLLHLPSESSHVLGSWLAHFTDFPLVTMDKSAVLRNGTAFVPPPGRAVSFNGDTIKVESAGGMHPATIINRSLMSAAKRYDERLIGVILTGLLSDGSAGLRAVHEAGGLTIVQNPMTAQFRDMPANAMKDLPVTLCLELSEIGPALD